MRNMHYNVMHYERFVLLHMVLWRFLTVYSDSASVSEVDSITVSKPAIKVRCVLETILRNEG